MVLTFDSKHEWMGRCAAAGIAGRGRRGYGKRQARAEVAMTPPVNFNAPKPTDVFDAHELFRAIAPPALVEVVQRSGPQAAYTSYVTLWMLLYQRLHGGASLGDAVSALLFTFPPEDLPKGKRVKDGLSADTG